MTRIDHAFVSQALRVAEPLRALGPEIERARRLPEPALSALIEAGAFKLLVPRAFGGGETSLATYVAVVEAIAELDGAAGWCTMVGATCGLMCGFLAPEVAHEVFAARSAVTAGVFAPLGRARRVDGGYQVSGRWPFASGCQHASHVMGGCIVEDGVRLESGAPDIRSMLFLRGDVTIHDTWDVLGLSGTGSHDFEVRDVFVPERRSFSFLTQRHSLPAYGQVFFGGLAAGVAGVCLGIARAAIVAFTELAQHKRPAGAERTLAQRELAQITLARAEARLRAARAGLYDAVQASADEAERAGEASITSRALLRLAACHAASESAAVVDAMYTAGGGTALYDKSPLQRHLRDIHTATQHVMVSSTVETLVGRVLLGQPADTTTL